MAMVEKINDELFINEQLLQKELALEQEQLRKAQLVKKLTEDFKKPVEQLIQFSNMALMRLKREEFHALSNYLAEMKMISEDLVLYLNDLRQVAALKAGECKFNLVEVDVKSVLKAIKKKFQPIADSAQVNLSFFMHPKGIYSRADEHILIKVMSILISRILHDLKAGDSIKVKVGQDDDRVFIYIIDNIPKHFDQKMIDQIFFKLDGPEEARTVPGYNLSVCKELMCGQKGDIEITSDDNETSCILTLPLSKDF